MLLATFKRETETLLNNLQLSKIDTNNLHYPTGSSLIRLKAMEKFLRYFNCWISKGISLIGLFLSFSTCRFLS